MKITTVLLVSTLLVLSPLAAGTVRQLTDELTTLAGPGALDDAGSVVYTGSSADLDGSNAEHRFQIVRIDPVTGAATTVTSAPEGTAAIVSVSDDGQWLAYSSPANLTGQNHDESAELYVMRSDGTGTVQLSDDPRPNAGSVTAVQISGDGSRVIFIANTDPLGQNPDERSQLFAVDRDGTGLIQLTQAVDGSFGAISISDDGTRVTFAFSGDLTGGNADLGQEVFAIDADGTNLRQLTTTPLGFGSSSPSISGNGARVVFQSNGDLTGGNVLNQDEIFIVDWAGTNLAQLTSTSLIIGITGDPASQAPSITDDAQTVVFQSNNSRLFPPLNIDGNFEIYRINADGTGLTTLTGTLLQAGSFAPTVAGSGGRIVYFAVDSDVSLRAMDGNGAGAIDLVAFDFLLTGSPDLEPDGSTVVFTRQAGLFDPSQIFTVESDGSGLGPVTSLTSGGAASPMLDADGATVFFSADSDPLATNPDLSEEIFSIRLDGTGLSQLTSGASGTASQRPQAATGADVVVFDSDADLTTQNLDGSREIFKMTKTGGGVVQLTDGPLDTTSRAPRVDATGTWVVFESNADLTGQNVDGSFEVFRVPVAGGAVEQITDDALIDSRRPDLSGDGALIVFDSAADPLAQNPEGNAEIFSFDTTTSTLTQRTVFAEGESVGARLTADGGAILFGTNAPVFEDDPDRPFDLYRLPVGGGPIERMGALRAGFAGGVGPISLGGGGTFDPDDGGEATVFSGLGDLTGDNPDLLAELWLIDRAVPAVIEVSKATPTSLRWQPESGPVRYDAIRGDVASLADGGINVDLGAVVCLEDDSPDADTVGFEDGVAPAAGQVFFFLYRGSQGIDDGPGSYGEASDGKPRQAAAGDCAG